MNRVYLIGRVTRDLELQHFGTDERNYVRFTLAVDEYNSTTKKIQQILLISLLLIEKLRYYLST